MNYHSAPSEPVTATEHHVPRTYAWFVFALSFGLLISDYMSRQVLNAIFPLLKSEWALSDAQLGSLAGVIALAVGILTFPLSLFADRWGRVKSLVLMAVIWSVATLACGISQNYNQMLLARLFVGVGEAAYGSVGIAVVLTVFPTSMRATLTGAFMAGGLFGSVLGVGIGGILAAHFGWRMAFIGMAAFGLFLALMYFYVVRESRINPNNVHKQPDSERLVSSEKSPLRSIASSKSVICAYLGSGLQLFIASAVIAWMPSYLNRCYGMALDRAGVVAAGFILAGSLGMIIWGIISDKFGKGRPERKLTLVLALCLTSCVLLSVGFSLSAGSAQLSLVAIGMFFATGTSGPAGAMVANLTNPSVHGSAFATLTLANNLLGLAPAPFVIGLLADKFGLYAAFQLMPLIAIFSASIFWVCKRSYLNDLKKAQFHTSENQTESNIAACRSHA